MGYTHHWKVLEEISEAEWGDIKIAARTIIIEAGDRGIDLGYEFDSIAGKPVIDNFHIRFNGLGDAGHETFFLSRMEGSAFCKTDYKPYDAVVVAMLITAARYAGSKFAWGSDGRYRDSYDKGARSILDAIREKA